MKDSVPVSRSTLIDALLSVVAFANRLDHRELGNRGLTLAEWTALSEIPAEGAGLALKKLIALTGLATQRIKVIVAKLEARGLIREVVGEGDSRSLRRFVLSETGLAVRNELLETFAKVAGSDLDQSQLRALARSARIVRRISKRLDEVKMQGASVATKVRR